MKAKLLFASLALLGSLLAGMLLVYLYGATFLHQRYWYGTIARVQETQAELLVNLVSEGNILQSQDNDKTNLDKTFKPLDGKMIVEIRRGDSVIFSNQLESRIKAALVRDFCSDETCLQLYAYEPPTWNYQFVRWLKNPLRWFHQSNDFITVPFMFFFLMILAMFYALGWRMRSMYLSRDVLEILRAGESEQK